MSDISVQELSSITNFSSLVDLLRDKLGWPIEEDYGFEDIIFEYEASELGLKPEETAKIREIHQLRPLTTNQPWGIFFLSFEEKSISVTVLRRMLRALVVKKRAGDQSADQQSWQLHDLIFITSFGRSGEREIAFAHFSDGEEKRDLPILNVLGWNANDTQLHNEHVAATLDKNLSWPDDVSDHDAWRARWGSAFELRHGEVINTTKDLALRLAALAGSIRAKANELLSAEADNGSMRKMLEAFRKNLIHDLDEDGFADMFAQTISYGLLAAHISRPSGGLVADNLVDMVPKTNPFLRELFSTFLSLGGRDKHKAMDFDELGIRDVVNMLRSANMGAVLRDFGNRNPKKDPVIHFYEDFLREYDAAQKVDAGIFYTPPAVVNFIVRGVDEVLRTEFGLPLGLADTATWGELAAQNDKVSVPAHITPDTPFVQILDPATGTGTFVVEVIDLIHKRMVEHWTGEGKSSVEIKAAWNVYVPQHLLPRLTAFELKMAAYAIAHMKIGLKLSETGYNFGSDERVHVLLTNSLQPPRDLDLEEQMRLEALAHESERANIAKNETMFTVVIGNPPYKGHSENPSKIKGKLTFAGELVQRFFQVRGMPLNERNPKWLNNDYVKFFGFALSRIEKSSVGVIGYITSNSWLDGPTFRGVRTTFIDTMPFLRIVDLHGNVSRREVAPDGTNDEGVFQINEGTNITISATHSNSSNVMQVDLLGQLGDGSSVGKLSWLEKESLSNGVKGKLSPTDPFFELVPASTDNKSEFYQNKNIQEIFRTSSVGIATANDALTIHFTKAEIVEQLQTLKSIKFEDIEAEKANKPEPDKWKIAYDFHSKQPKLIQKKEAQDWRLKWAVDDISAVPEPVSKVTEVKYRPFDNRWSFYSGKTRGFICRPREDVMENLLNHDNLSLLSSRMTKGETFAHVHVASNPSEVICLSSKTSNNSYVYLLWLKPADGEDQRRPNIDQTYAKAFGEIIGLAYEDGIPRNAQASMGLDYRQKKPEQITLDEVVWDGRGDLKSTFGPRNLFDWIYTILHAPGYRSRYSDFLKTDFPRIPTPKNSKVFQELIPFGAELIALHLLDADEAPVLANPKINFHGTGEARVARGYPKYENGRVMINPTRWFEDVVRETWDFHVGGYQVCQKWLKDRAGKGGQNASEGRILSDEDILHYRRTVTALTETRRVMTEIDNVINNHGGWPDAFHVPPPPPPSIEEILQVEESNDLEFKSTFQWDIKEGKRNKELQKATLKTLAAFMNTKGGTLVIGVTDDKEIHGLDDDLALTKSSLDVFEQNLLTALSNTIGTAHAHYCKIRIADATDGKKVCVIEVEPASKPAFLMFQGKEDLFIRRGNATVSLTPREQHDYVGQRFD